MSVITPTPGFFDPAFFDPEVFDTMATRNFGHLKERIADELARSDLTTQIDLAISDAIETACTYRFWFMEVTGLTVSLVASTATYTSTDIENLLDIDRAALIINGQRRTLRLMNDDERVRMLEGTAPTGEPYAFSRYGDTINVYPIPSQDYTLLIDGVTKGDELVDDTSTNIWTDTSRGERLVRAIAKRDLLLHVIRKPDAAQIMDSYAQRVLADLNSQTHDRVATNTMAWNG